MGEMGFPDISGQWINTTNGNIIEVQSSVMDGDELIITTTAGTTITGTKFTSEYLQIDATDNIYELQKQFRSGAGNVPPLPKVSARQLELDDDEDIFNTPKNTPEKPATQQQTTRKKTYAELQSTAVLDKIFQKAPLSVPINYDKLTLPVEPLAMACQFLDITVEQITDYILEHIVIDEESLKAVLQERLDKLN